MGKIKLRHMNPGQTGVISSVRGSGELGRRIRDMGLIQGKEIKSAGQGTVK